MCIVCYVHYKYITTCKVYILWPIRLHARQVIRRGSLISYQPLFDRVDFGIDRAVTPGGSHIRLWLHFLGNISKAVIDTIVEVWFGRWRQLVTLIQWYRMLTARQFWLWSWSWSRYFVFLNLNLIACSCYWLLCVTNHIIIWDVISNFRIVVKDTCEHNFVKVSPFPLWHHMVERAPKLTQIWID